MIKTYSNYGTLSAVLLSIGAFSPSAQADDVARQLANPVASLISVPVQVNYDENLGGDDQGTLLRVNIQPVVPMTLNDDWNLISRTILPLVQQDDVPFDGYSKFGLSDTVQSFFFSPKASTSSGWIWGAGPAFLIPTATDEFLGAEKWGAGPTAVALKQQGAWTYGALANHLESFAGSDDRGDVSATFFQPFLTYITDKQTTFALNTEATYDWKADHWSVPINFNINQLVRLGPQLAQIGGGIRYWASSPETGAEDWGIRLNFVLVFPK